MSVRLVRWRKVGEERVLATRYGKKLVSQMFVNPANNDEEVEFALYSQRDWSIVLAITEDGEVIVCEEYKQGRDDIGLELSAGTADFDTETPEAVMRRELMQETGYEPTTMIYLGFSWLSARNSPTKGHLFLATGCKKVRSPRIDLNELIVTHLMPLESWIKLVVTGAITEWSSALATIRSLPHLGYEIGKKQS